MNENKNRHTVWLTDEAWSKVKDHYRTDNCSTQNEYIEKAIQFYSGYLDTEQADSYLPRVLSAVLEGKLSALGSRIGKLLFKALSPLNDCPVDLPFRLQCLPFSLESRISQLLIQCLPEILTHQSALPGLVVSAVTPCAVNRD